MKTRSPSSNTIDPFNRGGGNASTSDLPPLSLDVANDAASFLDPIQEWLSQNEVENASFQDALFVPQPDRPDVPKGPETSKGSNGSNGSKGSPPSSRGSDPRERSFNLRGFRDPFFATVRQGEEIRLAAQMTPPRSLLLTGDRYFDGPVECLVAHLAREGFHVPSLFARDDLASRFAFTWTDTVGGRNHLHRTLRLHACDEVIHPQGASRPNGHLRLALPEDFDQILQWRVEMAREVQDAVNMNDLNAHTKRLLKGNQIYLWEDEFTVCMAVAAFSICSAVMIHDVYTPVPLRNRGYAKAVVADLSQKLLDAGSWDSCALYADIKNPIALSMYPKIGYLPLCDYQIRHFHP